MVSRVSLSWSAVTMILRSYELGMTANWEERKSGLRICSGRSASIVTTILSLTYRAAVLTPGPALTE